LLENLPPAFQQLNGVAPDIGEKELELPELERQLISRTLERVAGQRRQAAEILGISLDELNLKIRSYRLEG
jgi:DNA-binding NtrC family response regulator